MPVQKESYIIPFLTDFGRIDNRTYLPSIIILSERDAYIFPCTTFHYFPTTNPYRARELIAYNNVITVTSIPSWYSQSFIPLYIGCATRIYTEWYLQRAALIVVIKFWFFFFFMSIHRKRQFSWKLFDKYKYNIIEVINKLFL